MENNRTKMDDAFEMIEKMEEKFESMNVHSLLVVVGQTLHDTMDYSRLFNSFNSYMQFKNLYLDSKSSTLEEDLDNEAETEDKMMNEIYNQMLSHRREIEKTQMINVQQILRLQDMARRALEFAVEKSKTKAELLQCAKYIEFEIDDKDWANEIRKKAYAKNWSPSNSESSDTNNPVKPSSDFESFINENELDLMKHFSTKRPAAYEEFLKEEAEKDN
ncbi:hypothetical protein HUE87_05685 [Candidatus Sulfurimonas marisnigri]|uniref:Uncharacterized protein n=1 Tax=Candidatus Sulfurimonas marisnigri TaxID=2740405 RepID=A0A7S7M246_9BACT|nr:hypothetical protein [Candidatus Sulfurimonas marisnigri]QOY55716.1 hypothetical protein HUE87_05685 [Candidatus Sulfurimonas marisnigri]